MCKIFLSFLTVAISLLPTVFSSFSFGRFPLKFFQGFPYLFLDFFLGWLFFRSIRSPSAFSSVVILSSPSTWSFTYTSATPTFFFVGIGFFFLLLLRFFKLGKVYFLSCKIGAFQFFIGRFYNPAIFSSFFRSFFCFGWSFFLGSFSFFFFWSWFFFVFSFFFFFGYGFFFSNFFLHIRSSFFYSWFFFNCLFFFRLFFGFLFRSFFNYCFLFFSNFFFSFFLSIQIYFTNLFQAT